MNRLLPAAAVAAAALLLAACGGTPDRLAARHSFTGADQRKAKLVDLQEADVPSTYGGHGSQQSSPRECEPDLRDLTLTAVDLSKPYIEKDALGYVLGEVDAYRNPSDARAAFGRLTATTRLRCLVEIARHALARSESGRVHVEPLSFPVAVAGGALLGRRFVVRWVDKGKTHRQDTDDVYLRVGRIFAFVSFWHYGAPVPAPAETRVVRGIATRALHARTLQGRRTRPGGNTTRGE